MVQTSTKTWETEKQNVHELKEKDTNVGEHAGIMLDWLHYCENPFDDQNATVFLVLRKNQNLIEDIFENNKYKGCMVELYLRESLGRYLRKDYVFGESKYLYRYHYKPFEFN